MPYSHPHLEGESTQLKPKTFQADSRAKNHPPRRMTSGKELEATGTKQISGAILYTALDLQERWHFPCKMINVRSLLDLMACLVPSRRIVPEPVEHGMLL